MHRLKYVVFFVCLVLVVVVFAKDLKQGGKMDILNNKPMFEVRWKAANVRYFLMVNGFAIHREYSSTGEIKTRHPVNHLFRSGTNTVEIVVIPNEKNGSFSQGQKICAELWVYSDGKEEDDYKIGDICFQGAEDESNTIDDSSSSGKMLSRTGFEHDDEGDVQIDDICVTQTPLFAGALLVSRKFVIPNSLPLWNFFGSDEIEDPKSLSEDEYVGLRERLFVEYEKIQVALASGNVKEIDALLPMFEERNREIDLAYYKESGDTENDLRLSLIDSMTDSNKSLVEMTTEYVRLVREENKVIASLLRSKCKSAIVFNYTEFSGSTRYDIFFRRENRKWIICR